VLCAPAHVSKRTQRWETEDTVRQEIVAQTGRKSILKIERKDAMTHLLGAIGFIVGAYVFCMLMSTVGEIIERIFDSND